MLHLQHTIFHNEMREKRALNNSQEKSGQNNERSSLENAQFHQQWNEKKKEQR